MSLRFVFSPISATAPSCQMLPNIKSSSVPNSLFQALRPWRLFLASFAVKIFLRFISREAKEFNRQRTPRISAKFAKQAELGHYR